MHSNTRTHTYACAHARTHTQEHTHAPIIQTYINTHTLAKYLTIQKHVQ